MIFADLITPGAIIGAALWGWNKLDARLEKFEIALNGLGIKVAEHYATRADVKAVIESHEKTFHE